MSNSYEDDLIKRARELQRLATKRRRLKRQLKFVDGEIKVARKNLLLVKQASEDRRADAAPSRLHAGVTSVGTLNDGRRKPRRRRVTSATTDAFVDGLKPTHPAAKTGLDANGTRVVVGDQVEALDPMGAVLNSGTIVAMHRQGRDGTMAQLDAPPDPAFPHQLTHVVRRLRKVVMQ